MSTVRVLIIDDEPRLCELLSRAVARMGCDVASVGSAEEAERELKIKRYHVVVLDLNLPGKSGVDFMDDLHRDWPGIQVVVLTAYGDLKSAQKAIRHKLADYVTKPFDLGDIERALDRALRQLQAGGALAEAPNDSASAIEQGSLEAMERRLIAEALTRHRGNRTAAADELGITRRTLYNKMKLYRIQH